jgi:hypothetical protein
MKRKVAKMILIMGIGLTELIVDLELSIARFNSIEYIRSEKKIYLHIFHEDDDIELSYDFDDLDKVDKYLVYICLASILYN